MAERREIWDSIIKRSQKVAASVAKQAQTIAQTAQKKTVQTVDAVKVENQIKKTRQILQEEYAMLGQVVYQIEKGNVNRDDDVLKAACKRIERTLERIAELQEEKQKIGNDEAAETAELTAEIEKFLGTLSREKKRIFLMRYWSFMTVAEIAENLGIGESKVKVTLMRTREKLKQFLEKEGIVL